MDSTNVIGVESPTSPISKHFLRDVLREIENFLRLCLYTYLRRLRSEHVLKELVIYIKFDIFLRRTYWICECKSMLDDIEGWKLQVIF